MYTLRTKQFLKIRGKGGIMKMNKKQYNNIIDHTLKHENTADSLSTARAIFNNMGVALPNGDMKEVYETVKTDNYMGWKSCTMQEAQEEADNGTAAIGIGEDRIVVLAGTDEEEPVAQTTEVMTITDSTPAVAVAGLQYYSYSSGSNHCNCDGSSSSCYSNSLFNSQNKPNLYNELIAIMGNKQDSLSYNTTSECLDIILNYDSTITNYCNRYCIPKELVQTLLLRELWCVDVTDTVADDAVISYFTWKQQCEDWENLSLAQQIIIPYPEPPMVMRQDSSTGIGQMHASVAINANNIAVAKGLLNNRLYDETNWHDCRDIWYLLHDNKPFAIKMMTLEMHHCADYVGVCGSIYDCTQTQIKGILSCYNGTGADAITYGNECYEYYKIFKKYS